MEIMFQHLAKHTENALDSQSCRCMTSALRESHLRHPTLSLFVHFCDSLSHSLYMQFRTFCNIIWAPCEMLRIYNLECLPERLPLFNHSYSTVNMGTLSISSNASGEDFDTETVKCGIHTYSYFIIKENSRGET